jgi:hypothetical protein
MIAIEPISINYVKSLIKKVWRFQKPAEIIYKTGRAEPEMQSTPSNQTQSDPLKTLQLRLVRGEITREEYLKMKKILET